MCQVFPIVCPGGCIGPWTQMTSCPLPYIIRNGLRLAEKQPSKDRQGVAYNASSTLSASFPGRTKGCAIPTDLTLQIPVNLEIPLHIYKQWCVHCMELFLYCSAIVACNTTHSVHHSNGMHQRGEAIPVHLCLTGGHAAHSREGCWCWKGGRGRAAVHCDPMLCALL